MDSAMDMSVFRGFEPDKVVAELVKLGQLDRRLINSAWCNRDKKSRLQIIQKLSGEVRATGCAVPACKCFLSQASTPRRMLEDRTWIWRSKIWQRRHPSQQRMCLLLAVTFRLPMPIPAQ